MKHSFSLIAIFLFLTGMGAYKNPEPTHDPIYMSWSELRKAVELRGPTTINRRGKIYIYQTFILLNEPNKGIHIIDNEDPSNPIPIYFINIPGNVDMAVKNERLYADSFTDLVVLEFKHPAKIKEISRRKNVFDYNAYQVLDNGSDVYGSKVDQSKGVIIEWRARR